MIKRDFAVSSEEDRTSKKELWLKFKSYRMHIPDKYYFVQVLFCYSKIFLNKIFRKWLVNDPLVFDRYKTQT